MVFTFCIFFRLIDLACEPGKYLFADRAVYGAFVYNFKEFYTARITRKVLANINKLLLSIKKADTHICIGFAGACAITTLLNAFKYPE